MPRISSEQCTQCCNSLNGDYVVATGETHTVRDLCELAFGELGLDYREYVEVDPTFYRPAEVDLLLGDASKAKAQLNWSPTRSFKDLVSEMVQSDVAHLSKGLRVDLPTGVV